LREILIFWAQLAAKGFCQNPRWCPFKIKKMPSTTSTNEYLSVFLGNFFTPVSFRWTIPFNIPEYLTQVNMVLEEELHNK
jgi:hypothetical protein